MARRINRKMVYGILWIVVVFLVPYLLFDANPAKDFMLMTRGQTVEGIVTDASMNIYDDDNSYEERYSFEAQYNYKTLDGRTLSAVSHHNFLDVFSPDEPKPTAIEVEYIPAWPTISRIKGTAPTGWIDWSLNFIFYMIFVVALATPAMSLLSNGNREAVANHRLLGFLRMIIATNTVFVLARLLVVVLLVWALGKHPIGYYTVLRLLTCGVCGYGTLLAVRSKQSGWAFIFGTIAVLFQPFVTFRMTRQTWSYIDVTVAILLTATVFLFRDKPSKTTVGVNQ